MRTEQEAKYERGILYIIHEYGRLVDNKLSGLGLELDIDIDETTKNMQFNLKHKNTGSLYMRVDYDPAIDIPRDFEFEFEIHPAELWTQFGSHYHNAEAIAGGALKNEVILMSSMFHNKKLLDDANKSPHETLKKIKSQFRNEVEGWANAPVRIA